MKITTSILIFGCLCYLSMSAIMPRNRKLYHVESAGWHSGYRLDEHGGGNPQVYPKNDGDYQKWWVEETGDGYVYIRSYRSNNVLDSNADGNVYMMEPNGGWYQHWTLEYHQSIITNSYSIGDVWHIINRATGRYLSTAYWTLDTETDQSPMAFDRDDCFWRFYQI